MTVRADTARGPDGLEAEDVDQGLFLYGVVPSGQEAPRASGLDGASLQLVPHGRVAAVVSQVTMLRPPGRRADLVAYSEALDALASSGVVAPLRFGSVVPDVPAVLDEVLAPREERFAQLLEELRGRRQHNLRVTYVDDVALQEIVETEPEVRALRELTRELPEDAAYPERVRLGELVARALEQRAAEDAADVMDVVRPLVVAHAPRGRGGLESVVDVALLVDDEHTDVLVDRLEELAEAVHERMRVRLVGPVAPYDFVDGL